MTNATLIGKKLLDDDGGLIGTIDDIVVDPRSSVTEWGKVRFGVLRDRTLVPVRHITPHGRLPATCALTRDHVRSAPPVHDRTLDPTTRHRLLRHYGLVDLT
jgi:hypothetical protein